MKSQVIWDNSKSSLNVISNIKSVQSPSPSPSQISKIGGNFNQLSSLLSLTSFKTIPKLSVKSRPCFKSWVKLNCELVSKPYAVTKPLQRGLNHLLWQWSICWSTSRQMLSKYQLVATFPHLPSSQHVQAHTNFSEEWYMLLWGVKYQHQVYRPSSPSLLAQLTAFPQISDPCRSIPNPPVYCLSSYITSKPILSVSQPATPIISWHVLQISL